MTQYETPAMNHWTKAYENPAEAKTESAEIFAEHFIVEDEDGSILRNDLYDLYLRWTAEEKHKAAEKEQFFEIVNQHVSPKLTAITVGTDWAQRYDGIAISTLKAF